VPGLKITRQPYYRWLAKPVGDAELVRAYRADALFDAHRDDPDDSEIDTRLPGPSCPSSAAELPARPTEPAATRLASRRLHDQRPVPRGLRR
jgi:hypothetical protein